MEITVKKPILIPGSYPVVIALEPDEARLLREFFGKTNRIMEAELLGESVTSEKIQKLDELLYRLYLGLHVEGY